MKSKKSIFAIERYFYTTLPLSLISLNRTLLRNLPWKKPLTFSLFSGFNWCPLMEEKQELSLIDLQSGDKRKEGEQ